MKILVRKSLALSVLLFFCITGSSAHALPILNGHFSLVNDSSSVPYAPGELIASGTFTTADTVTDTIGGYDAAALLELFIVDETPDAGFGNISYTAATASNYTVIAPLFALFDQQSGDFVALQGSILDFANSPFLALTLNGVNANFGGATFAFSNLSTSQAESGFQIPEPSALALLGIGLFVSGFVRRKA